jgi:hypothetical protein
MHLRAGFSSQDLSIEGARGPVLIDRSFSRENDR